MGYEATVALGFDQDFFLFICSGRCVDFHCPHYLPGQTHYKNLKAMELRERLRKIEEISGLSTQTGEMEMGEEGVDEEEEEEEEEGKNDKKGRKEKQRRKKMKSGTGAALVIDEDALEEDWDPEKHAALMEAQFGDDYYEHDDEDFAHTLGGEDGGGVYGEVDDIEHEYYPDEMYEEEGQEWEGEEELDGEGEGEGKGGKGGLEKKTKGATEIPASMMDELYQLDYEDIIAGIPCRFKYKQVEPESFGLDTQDILLADDEELNKFVSLKHLSTYKKRDWSAYEDQVKKKRRKLRATLKERLSMVEEERRKVGGEGEEEEEEEEGDRDGEGDEDGKGEGEGEGEDQGGKKRRRRKKKNDNETGKSTATASFDAIIKKNNEQDQSEKKKKSSSFSGSSSSGNGSSNGGGDSSNSSKQRGLEVESGASPKGKTSALSEGEGEKKKRKKKKKRGEGPPAPKDRRLELYT